MQYLSSFTEETIQRGQQVCRVRAQLEDIGTVAPLFVCQHGYAAQPLSREGSCSSLTASSRVLHQGGKGPEAGAEAVAGELSP